MVLWGGLLPIPNQLLLDVATVVGCCLASGMLSLPSSQLRQQQQQRQDEDESSSKINETTTTATSSRSNKYKNSTQLLLASCLLTLSTSGLTNRWPLTIAMIPLWICHGLQRLLLARVRIQDLPAILKWTFRVLKLLSFLWIAVGAALAILFPAVQLPAVDANAPFDVGVVDFYVPIYNNRTSSSSSSIATIDYYVPARLWYPTPKKPPTKFSRAFHLPYLDPDTALDYCEHAMRLGAPPPLNRFGWILHTWRLMALPVSAHVASIFASENNDNDDNNSSSNNNSNWREHSSLFTSTTASTQNNNNNAITTTSIPLIFYSHGLGGSLNIYSYQAMELAAHGALVVSLTHADGSAPVVVTQPSQHTNADNPAVVAAGKEFHDYEILELWTSNRTIEYTRARRQRTDQRTREFLAATDFVHQQIKLGGSDDSATCSADNENNNNRIDYTRSSMLRNLLQTQLSSQGVTPITMFMGHSFGGATALTAAHRRPHLAKGVIAHEPATFWTPDDARRSLFAPSRLDGLQQSYDGGKGGYEHSIGASEVDDALTLHDHVDLLIMNSNEWMDNGEGSSALLQEMAQEKRLGRRHRNTSDDNNDSTPFFSISRHAVVTGSHHTEFSDTSMLTPLWLARAVNMTGPRNPIHTAREIATHTRDFVRDVMVVASAGTASTASTT